VLAQHGFQVAGEAAWCCAQPASSSGHRSARGAAGRPPSISSGSAKGNSHRFWAQLVLLTLVAAAVAAAVLEVAAFQRRAAGTPDARMPVEARSALALMDSVMIMMHITGWCRVSLSSEVLAYSSDDDDSVLGSDT